MLRLLKRIDYTLLITVATLITISIFMIFSASYIQLDNKYDTANVLVKHISSLLIGIIFLFSFIFFNYKIFYRFWILIYSIGLIILLYVLFWGHASQGAQRWINLGFLAFQPSEMAKLIIIIALASLLNQKKEISSFADIAPLTIIVAIPFLLIAKQPDLGTALVFIFIFLCMLLMVKTTSKFIFMLFSPVISLFLYLVVPIVFIYKVSLSWGIFMFCLVLFLIIKRTNIIDISLTVIINTVTVYIFPSLFNLLKPYQKERMLAFINPQIDPFAQGIRYHIDKSITAVASGGLWGQGWLKGALSHLQYIPVQTSDFIFSVIAEETGFIGSILVISLLMIIIYRGIKISREANDYFGSILAIGITSFFLFQIIVNIGMTIGIMPVVGIPLPFISFGGSALITNLAAIGLLESIHCRREKLFF